jgi:ABC-type dipeptide/oligopeptide/nickel transport system permease component
MTYLRRQAAQAVLLMVVILVSTFTFIRLVGDPIAGMADEAATQAQLDELRHSMGLDQPIPVQFAIWVTQVVQGDLGRSYFYGRRPVLDVVWERLANSVQVALAGVAISLLGVPLGMLAALRRGSWVDTVVSVGVLSGHAVPGFVMALALLYVFALQLRWTPVSGVGTWQHLVLPSLTLGLLLMPLKMRLVRASMIDAFDSDYVRTARSKGLAERTVVSVHMFRNVAITVIAVLGLEIARLVEGTIVVEAVFAWPGLGSLILDSVRSGDFPIIQAAVLVVGTSTVLLTFLTDIGVAAIDPRVRLQ